jgi:hypothetical protein
MCHILILSEISTRYYIDFYRPVLQLMNVKMFFHSGGVVLEHVLYKALNLKNMTVVVIKGTFS